MLLLSVAARATTNDCAGMAAVAPVTGAQLATFQLRAADGVCLQGYDWHPTESPARAVLVVIHGIRDHATRYAGLAQTLSGRGIAVVAQDHRGHGDSGGPRQRFDSVEQLGADIDLVVQEARRRYPGLPVFLFGHSLGGLASAHYALSHPQELRGVILSGPAIALSPDASALDMFAVRLFGRVWPSLPLYPVDHMTFVRQAPAREEMAKDPLIDTAKLPAASALTFLTGIGSLEGRRADFTVPLLILHGTADTAAPIQGSRLLFAQASSKDKTLHEVPGAFHDLWHEPEGPDLQKLVAQWILDRI
jgi:lysophospholipase